MCLYHSLVRVFQRVFFFKFVLDLINIIQGEFFSTKGLMLPCSMCRMRFANTSGSNTVPKAKSTYRHASVWGVFFNPCFNVEKYGGLLLVYLVANYLINF